MVFYGVYAHLINIIQKVRNPLNAFGMILIVSGAKKGEQYQSQIT